MLMKYKNFLNNINSSNNIFFVEMTSEILIKLYHQNLRSDQQLMTPPPLLVHQWKNSRHIVHFIAIVDVL